MADVNFTVNSPVIKPNFSSFKAISITTEPEKKKEPLALGFSKTKEFGTLTNVVSDPAKSLSILKAQSNIAFLLTGPKV